jgi:hypothetical protein
LVEEIEYKTWFEKTQEEIKESIEL